MLFTRCPECNTTFRVTDETLKKANGQVRCGRCASVFNAYAELHDPTAKSFEPEPVERAPRPVSPPPPEPRPAGGAEPAATAGTSAAAAPPQRATAQPEPPASHTQRPGPPAAPADKPGARADAREAGTAPAAGAATGAERVQEAAGAASGAEPTQDVARATDDAVTVPDDSAAISATEVERVLETAEDPVPQSVYTWDALAEPRPRSRGWSVAAALALVALGLQVVHHFRATIAGHPTFGPWIVAAYDAIGVTLTPRWDVRQYEILDWVASAEPNARGLGSLKITARIQNRGPQRQPYPAIELRLKDRWETAVGSRVFTPAEYLPSGAPRGRLMSPGETARAEIEVVDPGPDAYGFELDVCVEVEASLVTCGNDEIFL